jgi:hypothetical protein
LNFVNAAVLILEKLSEGKCCHQLRLVEPEASLLEEVDRLFGAAYSSAAVGKVRDVLSGWSDPKCRSESRVRRRSYVVRRLIERSIRRRRHLSSAHWKRE